MHDMSKGWSTIASCYHFVEYHMIPLKNSEIDPLQNIEKIAPPEKKNEGIFLFLLFLQSACGFFSPQNLGKYRDTYV